MSRLLAALFSLALLLTACGDDEGATIDQETTEPPGSESPPADGEGAGAEAGQATLTAGTTGLGDTLLDGSGRAVYLFDNDKDGASSCYDACANAWPPLLVQGEPVAGEGVDPAKLGTIARTDGAMQVTYAGHPLYHFAGDENPGDVNGHGVNDVWWLVRPDGTPIPKSEVGMGY